MMPVVVLGANGQLGRSLKKVFSASGCDVEYLEREKLDLCDVAAVSRWFAEAKPEVVINVSAYTAVDRAESEKDAAYHLNAEAVAHLAEECSRYESLLIHVSTDYVFDGSASTPYKPDAPTGPQSVYGASKLAGEKLLRARCSHHVIIRTAWVFSEFGNNFLKTMLRLGSEREELSIVDDQVGCPTYAVDLAKAIAVVVDRKLQGHEVVEGTFHYCGDKPISWYGFAKHIFEEAHAIKLIQNTPNLHPIPSTLYSVPARRPRYSVLDCTSFYESYGVNVSNWEVAIILVCETIKNGD